MAAPPSKSDFIDYLSFGSNMNEWRFQKYVDGFDSIDLTTIQRIGPVIVPKYGAYLGESLGTYFPTPWMTGGVFITPDKDRELHGVVYRLPRNAFEQLVSAECFTRRRPGFIHYDALFADGGQTLSPFPYGHLKVVNYRDRDGRPGTAVTCTAPWKFDEVLPSYEHITPEAFKTTPYRTSTGTKIVPHLAPPNMAYAKNLVVGLMSVGLSEDASFEELRTWPGTELLGMPTMLGEPTLPWDEFEAATRALSIEDCAPSGDAHIVEL